MFKKIIYTEILKDFKNELKSLPADTRITEVMLMKKFAISRNTSMKVLNILKSQGLVKRLKGSGTYPAVPADYTKPVLNIILSDSFYQQAYFGHNLTVPLYMKGLTDPEILARSHVCTHTLPAHMKKEKMYAFFTGLGSKNGCIFFMHNDPGIEICRKNHIPYMARLPLGTTGINGVQINAYGSVCTALEHLLQKHPASRILFLFGARESAWQKPIHQAVSDTLKKIGVPAHNDLLVNFSPYDEKQKLALREMLSTRTDIDAVFTVGFAITFTVYTMLLGLGREHLHRIKILAYNDPSNIGSDMDFISCIREPLPKVGKVLAEQVLDMIDSGYRSDICITLENEFIARGNLLS